MTWVAIVAGAITAAVVVFFMGRDEARALRHIVRRQSLAREPNQHGDVDRNATP